jgi:small multidrug resistance pump
MTPSRPGPTLLVLASYAVAMVLMARVVLVLPLGLTYATWSGLGIVATVTVGVLALIVAGVVIVNLNGPA